MMYVYCNLSTGSCALGQEILQALVEI